MLVFAIAAVAALTLAAEKPAALPVKEVTVFKDGHALVVAEGSLPVKESAVVLDELPRPVLGTFWPYAAQAGVALVSTTAGYRTVPGERSAVSLRELFAANPGKEILLREVDGEPYPARIVALTGDPAFPTGGLLLVQLAGGGTKALDPARVRDITFKDSLVQKVAADTLQPKLTLKLSGNPGASANVGVLYLQKGLRWIPGYKIDLDGKGGAHVKLQATLVNDLTDLDGVTANLVIGVPNFAFKDQADPIGIQQTVAALSPFFANNSRMSNGIMGQMAGGFGGGMMGGGMGGGQSSATPDPEVTGSERNEDLFVFTVKNLRLKRGERMTLPVAEFEVAYTDVYTLELLPTVGRTASGAYEVPGGNAELARQLAQPKARHQIRLTNTSAYPITTAPALLLRQGKVLAQSSTAYAAHGARLDIAVTDATEIVVKRTDKETKRTPDALTSNGYKFARVDLDGDIELRNFQPGAVELEVTRYVLGKVDELKTPGESVVLDPLADDLMPEWWGSYGNYADRMRFTGLGKVFWKRSLPPGGASVHLGYTWHYFTP